MTKLLQVSCSPDWCSKSVGSSPLAYQMLSRSHFLPSCGDDWIFTLSLSSFLCQLKGSKETKKEDTQCNPEHAYQLSTSTIGLLRKPLASLTETGHPEKASINIMIEEHSTETLLLLMRLDLSLYFCLIYDSHLCIVFCQEYHIFHQKIEAEPSCQVVHLKKMFISSFNDLLID